LSAATEPAGPFRLMGIVNVTPDSFSDGGRFLSARAAIEHGRALAAEGAHILDIGGESTRPGAQPVDAAQELSRVLPVFEGLARARTGARLSIDTSKARVAEAALDAGATFVNDVSALRGDADMAGLIADRDVDCCLMHMRGEPRTMQREPRYDDVVDDVRAFLARHMQLAIDAGVDERRIMLDPGIGFGKTVAHNHTLVRRLGELAALGRPLVIGTSRKSFLGGDVSERLAATIATNVLALERGASVFRVHDVAPLSRALAAAAATLGDDG
jgi:dihydropteroate synthase